jgi:hypothetical protein
MRFVTVFGLPLAETGMRWLLCIAVRGSLAGIV